jgi:hypothetical protein
MSLLPRIAPALVLPGILAFSAFAADPTPQDIDRQFQQTIRPLLKTYCVGCHGGQKPAAQFDLGAVATTSSVVDDFAHWTLLRNRVAASEMPPKVAPQPDAASRQKIVDWIDALRKEEARKNAGDPGPVLARRLSNAEYNYTIRDLTGVDIRPTREFPVDPANPAGFDNSGESLSMSPALMNKYLQAAREVADHMVLKPSGIGFAPFLALAETDRDKYAVGQIIDFYHRQDTDYGDYFLAAWRYKHRAALGKPAATLAAVAADSKVSPKYLSTIWRTLEQTKEEIGPLAKVQEMWRALPAPKGNQPDAARDGCNAMRDYVVKLRKKIEYHVTELSAPGVNRTAQPLLMWRNREYATHRRDFDRAALQVEGEWKPVLVTAAPKKQVPADNADEEAPPVLQKQQGPDSDLHVPAGQRAAYEAAFGRFASVFPDTFYIQERGRYFPDNTRDKGRYLSAGFHNLMGYFRDDQPLYDLILDAKQQKQLDGYWQEMDFVASTTTRTYVQFYLFESREAAKGPDSGAAIPDKEITSEARIMKLKETYLNRARASKNPAVIKAVEDHFDAVNSTIRWVERARVEAEPSHLDALLQFAARAYRRPLTPAERSSLLAFYHSLREKDGLSHEDAMRDSLVSVLMSPDFCYRIDLVEAAGQGGARPSAGYARPLSDYAVASRLSYFLWSSMPDEALLARAAAGDLHRPEVLTAQVRRMLKDPKAVGLATEFGGNWLDFRRFEEHNAVDRERFPVFTNELREAMFQEPVRYIADVMQNNRSILDLVYGNYTFVNPVLAKHYGMPEIAGGPDMWVRVDDARKYGRGGLLPMAAFLTKNAPGLRTSPVKRGYWVVKRVLGEVIPPPPAVVPELPRDEAKLDLPLRDMLARHRSEATCAACHAKFDGFGLAFEGYGPVGEARTKDLAGHDVDTHAPLPGGVEAEGLEGVVKYIREHRQNEFVDSLCRKLMVYALGRSLILSDEPAIEAMRSKLAANGYRFNTLVESIVTSPQFVTKRGPELVARKGE